MTTSKKVALSVVVVLLIALGIFLRERVGSDERPKPLPGEVAVLAPGKQAETTERAAPTRLQAEPSEVVRTALESSQPKLAEEAPAEGSLLLRVSWHDGTPAAGIGAFVQTGESMFEGTREVRTDEAGACRIDHLKPRKIVVRLDRQGMGGAEIKAGELVELSLTISDGNDLQGIVVEADGSPVAGAEIYVDHGFKMGHIVAHSGPDGRFSVRSISRGMVWLSARAPFHPPTHQVMVGGVAPDKDPRTENVRLVFLARGGALQGVLRDGEGNPVSNAQVLVGREVDFMHQGDLDQIRLPDGSDVYLPSAQRLAVDDDGRFSAAGVAIGKQPVRVRAPGFGQWTGEAEIREGEVARIGIVLLPGTTVEGTLRDFGGRPLKGPPIALAGEYAFHQRSDSAAADGSYALHDLPLGDFELVVCRDGAPTSVSVHLVGSPGAVLRWDPVLGTGLAIRGRIVARGLDLREFMICCTGVTAPGTLRSDTAQPDSGGWFEFTDRDDVPHRIVVSSSLQPMLPLAVLESVTPSGKDLVV
ncbi:MAG: carboxypeptidase-like regulatory domain-containing protein, partial [Planctomycetota bacterium]